jgi:hypothetical protein
MGVSQNGHLEVLARDCDVLERLNSALWWPPRIPALLARP